MYFTPKSYKNHQPDGQMDILKLTSNEIFKIFKISKGAILYHYSVEYI